MPSIKRLEEKLERIIAKKGSDAPEALKLINHIEHLRNTQSEVSSAEDCGESRFRHLPESERE